MKPIVSVIMPVKNGAPFLIEAVESVAAALASINYELLIINDGSTDETEALIKNSRIQCRYFPQDNMGAAAARNVGLIAAQGSFIAFIDADDVWTKDHFTVLYTILTKNPAAQIAMGYSQRFLCNSKKNKSSTPLNYQEQYGQPVLLPSLGCALFRTAIFDKVGMLTPEYYWHEDIDWYLRALELGVKIIVTHDVVKYYRIHEHNTTHTWKPTDTRMIHVLAASLRRRKNKILPALNDSEYDQKK